MFPRPNFSKEEYMSRTKCLSVFGVVSLFAVVALFPCIANVSCLSGGKSNVHSSPITSPAVLTADGTDPVPPPIPFFV